LTAAGPTSDVLAEARRWNPDIVFHKPVHFTDVETWLAPWTPPFRSAR
jgi:hypothetical protein